MKIRLFTIAMLILLSACSNLNKLSLYNLSTQYDNTLFTEIEAVAVNSNDGSARIFLHVEMGDFISAFDEKKHKSHRDALISYELFETYESKQILDSASFLISDSSLLLTDTLFFFDIKYPGTKKYILKIELTDMNRVDAVNAYLWLDNSGPESANDFILKDKDGQIMFSNVLGENEAVILQLTDVNASKLFVRYYNRDFPLALPPFLEETETNFNYSADSVFIVEVEAGRTELMHFADKGFYHFQTDSNRRGGYTIFRFERGFPQVQSPEQMLQPLRYITTITEFAEMSQAVDIKLAVDNFWLNNAGNPTRARAMIQKYYGRVVEANRYFSSYHEGWKTDRGLVYIVYGPPKVVYRAKNIEEWLYGEKGNKNSIRLQFIKVLNPFSENDYSLIKSPSYKEKWYNIVNTWRR